MKIFFDTVEYNAADKRSMVSYMQRERYKKYHKRSVVSQVTGQIMVCCDPEGHGLPKEVYKNIDPMSADYVY